LEDVVVSNGYEDLVDEVCDFKTGDGLLVGSEEGLEALGEHVAVALGNPLGCPNCVEEGF